MTAGRHASGHSSRSSPPRASAPGLRASGLSMVYGFAKQSRGHVKSTARSVTAPASGCTCPGEPEWRQWPSRTPRPSRVGRETILLVEDDAAVRIVAVGIVQASGTGCAPAEDGRMASTSCKSSKPHRSVVHRSDHAEWHERSGSLREARLHRPDLKVLFTSGYSESFIDGRGETDETAPLLSKPYRRQKLAQRDPHRAGWLASSRPLKARRTLLF